MLVDVTQMPACWKVRGDCRCLFRAIYRAQHDPRNRIERDGSGEPRSSQLRLRERDGADGIRRELCSVMRARRGEVQELLAGTADVEGYLARLEDWRTWGDAICLRFLPDVVKRPIQVYAHNIREHCIFDSGMHLPCDESLHKALVVVLWYDGDSHYDLVSLRWLEARERAICLVGGGEGSAAVPPLLGDKGLVVDVDQREEEEGGASQMGGVVHADRSRH